MKKYCAFSCDVCSSLNNSTPGNLTIFTAYSSHHKAVVDEIKEITPALTKVTNIQWLTWEKDLNIEDDLIFCEICRKISSSIGNVIELSDLNFNVIFEYGYSIGLDKKVFPVVNSRFDFQDIDKYFYPIMGIGLAKYEPNKLLQKITKKSFWEKEKNRSIYGFDFSDILTDDCKIDKNNILYLKNCDRQDVSEAIEDELYKTSLEIIFDDTNEELNNIIWFSKQIKKSFAVIIDLGLSSSTVNTKHFLKCALVAGIAVATGRRVLILNSESTRKPSDIISIIKSYQNNKDAAKKVRNFLEFHSNEISVIYSMQQVQHKGKTTIFDNIDIGDYIAENDKLFLENCFIENPEYHSYFKSGYKLIIGRKGSGKSAAFIRSRNFQKPNNRIYINKSFNKYNLNDLYELIDKYNSESDQFKISSAYWKYILYMIIADSIYKYAKGKDKYTSSDEMINNDEFCLQYEKSGLALGDKSITEKLLDIITIINANNFVKVSEILPYMYQQIIYHIKNYIIQYFSKTKIYPCINIDGLDANITIKKNIKLISLILYSLNDVCSNLFEGKLPQHSINIFIRTDLYDTFKDRITEKDKIKKIFIHWDQDYLLQMINERLYENEISHLVELLDENFNIRALMEKMNKYVYQRPRDYMFIFINMINVCQSQKKDKIDKKAFDTALHYYVRHVAESLEAEFISLPFKIDPYELFNRIKNQNNNHEKIPIFILLNIIDNYGLTKEQVYSFLTFLLRMEIIMFYENNQIISWNNLFNQETKLRTIIDNNDKRQYFQLHPIITKIVSENS